MKCIILPAYNANVIRAMKSLEMVEKALPRPRAKQVMIKVAAAPCNPSDIAFMRGGYNIHKPVPVVMGFECSGTVVDSGDSPEASKLIGRRVSAFTQSEEDGTWAEYFVTDWSNCIELHDEISFEQASALCVNPFTAYALFTMAQEGGVRTILQNGASGQVGIFIRSLARKEGVRVVNIVRKPDHVRTLQKEGEKHVVCSADADFEKNLREALSQAGHCIGFDAAGGELSGMMLNAMPEGSELILYGGLSGKPVCGIDTLEVIFKSKVIRGFNLGKWKEEIGPERFKTVSEKLQHLIIKGTINTRIQGTFKLRQVQEALEQYIRNMSSGKILFAP
jgi:NADPH:quinone reductase-like Zn-dependent oxidoreductase